MYFVSTTDRVTSNLPVSDRCSLSLYVSLNIQTQEVGQTETIQDLSTGTHSIDSVDIAQSVLDDSSTPIDLQNHSVTDVLRIAVRSVQ